MGFRSSRRSTTQEADAVGQTTHQWSSGQQQSPTQQAVSSGVSWTTDIDRAEQQFGMTIPDAETLQRLQIAEETHGQQVHDWVEEGMTAEILGKTRDMEAFRQRQAERPPDVPTNIERQNKRSVLRSEQAAAETSSAGETGVPDSVREVISSSGRSLDASIQRAMEDRMGESFGDVQIHTGSTAAAACEAINARAFTVGSHIAFNQGEYDPESPEGQHVLAHELAHVRQQTGGAVSMLPQADLELEVDPDPALERDAEETAQRVMQGGELGIQRMAETEVHVQRIPTVDRESTYLSGNQGADSSSRSLFEKVDAATAVDPSPSVADVGLGGENIAEFQNAVREDIRTLYEKVEQQGLLSQMSDAGTGEAIKIGMTEAGKQSGVPLGAMVGSLSGAALQAIYENRDTVLEFLGLKSDSTVDSASGTGAGKSTGDAKSRRK
jgi:hypothetical protein